jgi:glycosyltransferase involved in cell wall biosynthesis
VNWNPVSEHKPLVDEIERPANRRHVYYRVFTVSDELHQLFIDPDVRDTVPLFEFIAKNVGIRRAKGEYLLLINGDILIHPNIFESINSKFLDSSTYYRADRLDYDKTDSISTKEFFDKGFMIFKKGSKYRLRDWLSKDFQLKWMDKLNKRHISWELYKYRYRRILQYFIFTIDYNNGGYYAHCQASGDFMLMKKANWLRLRGYPEYTSISTHTDSLFTILAKSRFNEFVFDEPIFHQAHERRYGWSEIQEKEDKFAKAYRFFEDVVNVYETGASLEEYFNSEDWGLKDQEIPEIVIRE